MKKKYIAIILVLVVIGIALLLIIKSCGKDKTDSSETSAQESTLAVVSTESTAASTTAASETTKQGEKKVDDVIKTSTFVSLTASKSALKDMGDYYELTVSVNEKDSSGNIYTSGTDTIKLSKSAVVTWYKDSSFTDTLTLNEYFSMSDYIRMYYSDFNGNTIYKKDSNGYVVAFFDGQFS